MNITDTLIHEIKSTQTFIQIGKIKINLKKTRLGTDLSLFW